MENVKSFMTPPNMIYVLDVLNEMHYVCAYRTLNPTKFGWPHQRKRFYLLAVLSTEQTHFDLDTLWIHYVPNGAQLGPCAPCPMAHMGPRMVGPSGARAQRAHTV